MTIIAPPLIPSGRLVTPGERQTETIKGGAGDLDRLRTSAALAGQSLRLRLIALSLDKLRQLRAHWINVGGTSGRWPLSPEIEGVLSRALPLAPPGYLWRYVEPPETQTRAGCLFDVSVSLLMLPPPRLISGGDAAIEPPTATITVETEAPVVVADLILEIEGAVINVYTSPPVISIS